MKASEYYHHPKYLFNCAQAIVYKWSEINGISTLRASDLRGMGSGRAPKGICGALHGALMLFDGDSKKQEQLTKEFEATIGSALCRTIRMEKLAACKQCIDVVDGLVEQLSFVAI